MYRAEKARIALANAKPAPFGWPYSWSDIRSSYLMEEDMSVMMHSPMWRISDEQWPVAMGNSYFYQLGPFTSTPLQASDLFLFHRRRQCEFKIIGDCQTNVSSVL